MNVNDPLRICLVGAESTGTTSLTRALASRYRTQWVPEYGREYTEVRRYEGKTEWLSVEFEQIARQQQSNEDAFALRANQVLFCDTDALATCIWHERYMQFWSHKVEAIAEPQRYAHYFLTDCDIPFVPDRIRDSEHLRVWMTQRFAEEFVRRQLPWTLLSGAFEHRLEEAVTKVDQLLLNRPR